MTKEATGQLKHRNSCCIIIKILVYAIGIDHTVIS